MAPFVRVLTDKSLSLHLAEFRKTCCCFWGLRDEGAFLERLQVIHEVEPAEILDILEELFARDSSKRIFKDGTKIVGPLNLNIR